MEFRNLTPFSVMEYAMHDKNGERYHVIAMKIGFRLVQSAEGQWQTRLMENPALPLCLEDKFFTEINTSPVRQESDLAPFKPVCDIIVNGTAYTPNGVAASETNTGVLIHSASGEMILNKRLLITGKRFYRQQALTGQWYETEPEPFTSLPLNYRYTFGGECRIEPDSEYADRIPTEYRLTDEQRLGHPAPYNPPLAHTVCPFNPLGMGFMVPWYQRAGKSSRSKPPESSQLTIHSPFIILLPVWTGRQTGLRLNFSLLVLAASVVPGNPVCRWPGHTTRNGWKSTIRACRRILIFATGTPPRMTNKFLSRLPVQQSS